MIDFRYHVVSLVAVLLALATGILVGSSFGGTLFEGLTKTTEQLRNQTDNLREQVQDLQRTQRFGSAFVDQVAPDLVSGKLDGDPVVIVRLPGAEQGTLDAATHLLEESGAVLTGVVEITPAYADSAQDGVLDELVNQLAPAGTEWPGDSGVFDRAGLLLAMALVTDQPGQFPDPAGAQILTGLQAGGFVSAAEAPTGPAALALVLAGPSSGTDNASRRATDAHLKLATVLDQRSKGVVVAGPVRAAADGGMVAAVRSNGDVANVVSTIDVVDTPIGRVGVVYALDEQSRGGSGQYGISGTTDGPLPDLSKEGES